MFRLIMIIKNKSLSTEKVDWQITDDSNLPGKKSRSKQADYLKTEACSRRHGAQHSVGKNVHLVITPLTPDDQPLLFAGKVSLCSLWLALFHRELVALHWWWQWWPGSWSWPRLRNTSTTSWWTHNSANEWVCALQTRLFARPVCKCSFRTRVDLWFQNLRSTLFWQIGFFFLFASSLVELPVEPSRSRTQLPMYSGKHGSSTNTPS